MNAEQLSETLYMRHIDKYGLVNAELKAAAMLRRQHEAIRVLRALLSEVSQHFTREDDLPKGLLPRIDAAIAKVEGGAA